MIAITDGDVVYKVRADNSGLEKDIKSAENMLISAADTVESAIIGSAKALGTGALAIAAGTAAIGTAAVGTSDTLDKAVSKIISATGASADSAEKLDKVVKEIYSDNFGEDFDDIANSISKITQNLGEMDEVSLVNITESAYALQDVFEYGVDESSRAAKAMAENFGISAERAYDYIARGAQNGLDYSGELLDSISEYSVQFAKMGLDADDMFNIFQQGAESGAWNLDKIGDAVKEMSIRVIDGSDSTIAGFEKIGLNADEMAARFSMGGSVARAAFTETLKALSDMEDPLERDAAGVALLGTMWEDLGPEAVSALADISDEAYECAGAVDGIMDVSYSSLSDALDGLKRQAKMLTQPLGESLIPLVEGVIDKLSAIADEVIPQMVTAAEPLVGALLRMSEPISELISELLPPLVDIASEIIVGISDLVSEHLPSVTAAIKGSISFLSAVIKTAWECRDVIAAVTVAVGAFAVAIKIGNAVSAAVNAVKSFKTATEAAKISQLAMNAAAAANPYVLIGAAAAAAVGDIMTFCGANGDAAASVDKLKQEIDELHSSSQELIGSAEDYMKTADGIDDIADEYKTVMSSVEDTAERSEDLREIQDMLIDQYGDQAAGIDLVNGKYDEQLGKLDAVIAKNKEVAEIQIKDAYKQAVNAQSKKYEVGFDYRYEDAGYTNPTDTAIKWLKNRGYIYSEDDFWSGRHYYFKDGMTYKQRADAVAEVTKLLEEQYGLDNIDDELYSMLSDTAGDLNTKQNEFDEVKSAYDALGTEGDSAADRNTSSKHWGDTLAEERRAEYERLLADLERSKRRNEIDDEEYFYQLEKLIESYLEWGSEEYESMMDKVIAFKNRKTHSSTTDDTDKASGGSSRTYSAASKSAGRSSTSSGGSLISISSYIPTMWSGSDDSDLLRQYLGAGLVGNSSAAHTIDALTGGAVTSSGTASAETTLADVVNAITKLQRKVESIEMSFEVELKARDLTIGRAAVRDINDLAKQSGKSPFDF